ncbi:MAG TPA: NHL repeat-containing protein, partial [Chloroflexota bacterium]|nr:NHL repeat-containing protein [Chloroflexota bacterium]
PPANAPVVLTGMENGRDTQMKQQLGTKYVSQRYRLRWWFPEDTTYRNLTFTGIVQGLLDARVRNKLWRYLMYRETPSALGSTDFMMFVRRDLAYGPWAAPQADTQTPDETVYTTKARTIAATSIFGFPGNGNGQFQQPKGMALGPDGNLYVADSQNHRIEVVTPTGQFVRAWGTKGKDPGQFNEPWGVAVSPQGMVYVADTWNHRVQEFSTDGKFIRTWGGQPDGGPHSEDGQFFGPRAIAIDSAGNVYVTDTGNKRIEKFTADGAFISSIGGPGSGAGFFNEPVGLAFDQSGNLFVADAWNQRVQKFGPDLKPISSFPVAAWDSQSVVDKPFLTVDSADNVYVSDPQNGRIIEFNAAGQLFALWGLIGTDQSSFRLPTGLVVDATGSVFVSDSDNNRIMKFAPIK